MRSVFDVVKKHVEERWAWSGECSSYTNMFDKRIEVYHGSETTVIPISLDILKYVTLADYLRSIK